VLPFFPAATISTEPSTPTTPAFRPSLLDQFGDVAGPGAKIGNTSGRKNPESASEDRPRVSIGGPKIQILLRIPYHR